MVTTPSRLRAAPADPATPISAAAARRSYPLVGAGLLAALVGALLFATIAGGSDDRRSVLVMAKPVAAGDPISGADVTAVKLRPVQGMGFMDASTRDEVLGRPAAGALVPGSLLLPGQIGSPTGLPDGQAAVGLVLDPGRYPPGLHTGDHVAVVSAPTGPAPSDGDSLRLGTGVVEHFTPAAGAAGVSARIRVDAAVSDRIAAEGAARRVALVLLPNGTTK